MKVSKALQEVWDMKQAAYEETKHLQGPAYFAYIHQQVRQGLPPGMKLHYVASLPRTSIPVAKVAEAPAEYRTKREK